MVAAVAEEAAVVAVAEEEAVVAVAAEEAVVAVSVLGLPSLGTQARRRSKRR